MSQVPKHRQLPDKESKLFKELLVQYEHKQYKKGLKAADSILKKFPNHGETLALKALTLFSSLPFPPTAVSMPKQEEAEALAKVAVKKDLTSHITWHVLGIMAKSRKDWEEASRAFAMARRQDADNLPIIRDSISLYLHTRQYPAAVAARHHYFLLRPNLRSSWLSLMVAHQLSGNNEEALEVFDALSGAMNADGANAQEKSQLMLNVVKMCIALGRDDDGLRRLERGFRDKVISPRGEASQLRAEMLLRSGRREDAEDAYRSLLEQNPDNLEYYRGFLRTKELDISAVDESSISQILHQLDTLAQTYSKSPAPLRLALTIATGTEFRSRIRPYLVNGLEKGIPSLFVDVKSLYADADRMAAVGEVVEEIIETLQKEASLHGDGTAETFICLVFADPADATAPPTALLWGYYYLALHLSHPLHPNPSFKRSLDLLEVALKHTPTLPEVYMAKAMVLKRAGNPMAAAHTMEEARLLDGQDRFLNGKAAKYWLRAGEIKKAEELLAMFTKKDMTPMADLTDLQCLWFLQEEGDAYRRTGNLAMALKRYQATVTVFQDYEDDQYDFHTYCMRRMTVSAYLSLMRYEDQLRSHPAYFKCALSAIEIYTRIHDDPSLTEEKISAEEEAERKKAAKKAQKADQKAKKGKPIRALAAPFGMANCKAAAAAGDSKKEDGPLPDADPTGQILIKTATPLEDAYKLWTPLEKLAAGRVETWLAGYEIQSRRNLWPAAFKCILAAHTLDPDEPKLASQIIHFLRSISAATDVSDALKSAFSDRLPSLQAASAEPRAFSAEILSRHTASPSHILGSAQALAAAYSAVDRKSLALSVEQRQEIIAALEKLATHDVPPSVPIMLEAVSLLQSVDGSSDEVEAFKRKCKERAPLAVVLASTQEKVAEKLKALNGAAATDGAKADV